VFVIDIDGYLGNPLGVPSEPYILLGELNNGEFSGTSESSESALADFVAFISPILRANIDIPSYNSVYDPL
jgi:hypothetical protein